MNTEPKLTMTNHVVTDRIDRTVFIAQYIGWGNVIYKVKDSERNSSLHLTTTGVVLVKSWDETQLITTYPATMSQALAIVAKLGMTNVPHGLALTIAKNQKIMRRFYK